MIAELAKLAETMPSERAPAEREEDSGVVHLASLMTLAPPVPPEGGKATSQHAVGRWLAIAAVGAIAFVGGALAVRRPPRPTDAQPILLVPAPATRLAPAEPAPAAEQSSDDGILDLPSLPPATSAGAPPAQPAVAHPKATVRAAVSATVSAAPVSPAAHTARETKSLGELIQEAVGGPHQATPVIATAAAPAADLPDEGTNAPTRPSLGAIKSAIGAVLPAAHECLDDDVPVSHANITFRSDGSVAAVAISGWAAGKPVEACIRRAPPRARVPPFRQATYAVPATIRSN